MKKQNRFQPLKAMMGAWSHHDVFGKVTIVVDDDIDIRDSFQVEWALSFRMQPAEDVIVVRNTDPLTLDPSQPWKDGKIVIPTEQVSSKVGIDATKKHHPPLAVPPREHLQRVDAVLGPDDVGRVLGRVPVTGDHDSERLADVADLLDGEDGLARSLEAVGHDLLPAARDGDLLLRHRTERLHHVVARHHRHHAGHGRRLRGLDADDTRVRELAAHDGGVEHPRALEVADVDTAPGEEAAILTAENGTADEAGYRGIRHRGTSLGRLPPARRTWEIYQIGRAIDNRGTRRQRLGVSTRPTPGDCMRSPSTARAPLTMT
jgi:3-polyprenyl-4-hydroxybenzoate decarboxylase